MPAMSMALMPGQCILLLSSLLNLGAAAVETTLAYDGKVHVLTESNLSVAVRKFPYTFVEFYAPWCSACKQMESEWEKTAKIARTYDVPVAMVDVTTESGQKLAEEHGIVTTPTLLLFKGDTYIKATYYGHREANLMTDWMGNWIEGESVARPEPTQEGVKEDWAPMARLKVLGLLSGEAEADSALEELIGALALLLNPSEPGSDVPVGLASLPPTEMATMNISCATLPCIVFFRDYDFEDDKVLIYEEDKSNLKIRTRLRTFMAWIESRRMPKLIPASEESQKLFLRDNAKKGNSIVIYFGDDESAATEVHKLAVEFSPKIPTLKWVRAAKDQFGEDLGDMVGLQAKGFPEFVLWEFGEGEEDDRIFKLSKQAGRSGFPTEDLSQILRSFVEGWQAGSATPEQDPVLAVTKKTFEEVVYDKSKDVLVEFYAPWCGACKAFAPEYKQVGRHYEDDEGVSIVKMDAIAHSHRSAKINSFPTLMIYTASNKGKPITLKFEAGRDKQTVIDAVEKHRSTPSPSRASGDGTCAAGDASCNAAAKAADDDDDDDPEFAEF